MDIVSLMRSLDVDNTKKNKPRKKRRSKKLVGEKKEAETRNQMNDKLGKSNNPRDCEVTSHNLEMDRIETDLIEKLQQGENPKIDADSTENLSKGNASRRKRKRVKRSKKAKSKDVVQGTGQANMDAGYEENPLEGNVTSEIESKWRISEMAESKVDDQSMDLTKMDTGSTENRAEGNAAAKRKRKKERKRKRNSLLKMATVIEVEELQSVDENKIAMEVPENCTEVEVTNGRKERRKETVKCETESMNQIQMHEGSKENLIEGIVTGKRKKKRNKKKNAKVELKSMDQITMATRLIENQTEGNAYANENSISGPKVTTRDGVRVMDQNKMGSGLVENFAVGNSISNRRRERKRKKKVKSMDNPESMLTDEKTIGSSTLSLELQRKCFPSENQSICDPNSLDEYNRGIETRLIEDIIVNEGNDSAKRSAVSTCNVKDAEYLSLKIVPVASTRRKLLVLDVNGLLADIVKPAPKHCSGTTRILGRAIFKRPFCHDFLKFCFQNFDVGIWSSRSSEIICKIVKYLLGDLQEKLLFCWDMSHCTRTGFKTLENRHKPLVCKELRRIWENDDPNSPWKKGTFDESNTLLVDDSQYKALLNPLHTAIFPSPYRYVDKNDNALGPEGEIRAYLEELAKSENMQKHVEQHPFGRHDIDNSSRGFYNAVLDRMSTRLENKTHLFSNATTET